jgi:Nucleotide-diphospho-sugar transferase
LALLLFGKVCVDLGMLIGSHHSSSHLHCISVHEHFSTVLAASKRTTTRDAIVGPRRGRLGGGRDRKPQTARDEEEQEGEEEEEGGQESSSLVAGAARVKRVDFAALVDVGVPIDPAKDKSKDDDVLILYTSSDSLPGGYGAHSSSLADPTILSAEAAIENCLTMKVVLTEQSIGNNCIAVMGHAQESLHVHRFHRLPEPADGKSSRGADGGVLKADKDLPLRQVPRHVETRGVVQASGIPTREVMDSYFEELVEYLSRLKGTLQDLAPIAQNAAGQTGNTIVAMSVNEGQSELFVNFVCTSRARGLDVSNVLLFATDAATAELASSLGVHVFEVKDAYGAMPTGAAGNYGDKSFARMVLSKVYSVHLLVLLGYDVLLQDVDVVWRRNPLEFFQSSPEARGHDLIFQDDGSRLPRFAPYFANTGFYFVRTNERTVYFFNHLIRMGEVIEMLKCDQKAMSVLLPEHVSWKGLKVKVFGRDTPIGRAFPGGFHFHQRHDYMRELLTDGGSESDGDGGAYVFHMSWTKNKHHKREFMVQMGEWHVKEECPASAASQGEASTRAVSASLESCCSAEPMLGCHYRDVASKLDCRDSIPLSDPGRQPFWKDPDMAPVKKKAK